MCGIRGILNFSKENKVDQEMVRQMALTIKHRGPDDEGFYFKENLGLGHRRLSIIDLDSGHQPMSNEDETIWIVCNGEIYNYIELTEKLKAKGHVFKSSSDTEVIIHLYEEYGEDCLQYLNGMFAFVVWDEKNVLLFAARDRAGIKPFYYYYDKERFVFASEIKAIIEDKKIVRLPNYKAIAEYLRYMYSVSEETFFKGIKKLMPGHYIQIGNNVFKKTCYWQVPQEVRYELTEDEVIEKLYSLINDAVRLHLRSDVPIGSHLRGGLDSGTIAALAQHYLNGRLSTFSIIFKDAPKYNEESNIKFISQYLKTNHHEQNLTSGDCLKEIYNIVRAMDEPQAGSGVIGHYFLSRLISRSIKVVFGGGGRAEMSCFVDIIDICRFSYENV